MYVNDIDDDLDTRTVLLERVEQIAPILAEERIPSEERRALTPRAIDAMKQAGLFAMRLPREFGGHDSSFVTQILVLEGLARIDASSAWCAMLANNASSRIAESMPESVTERVFKDGAQPVGAAVAELNGQAVPTDGGFLITGAWKYASGIRHSEWVTARTWIDGDPEKPLTFTVPTAEVTISDSWNVIGLRGTGSCDFAMNNTFVPTELTVPTHMPPQIRGSRMYSFENTVIGAYEHIGIALGIGRRALDEATATLAKGSGAAAAANSEVVQSQLSQHTLRLDAFRTESLQHFAAIDVERNSITRLDPVLAAKIRALATLVTEEAAACV